MISLPNHCRLCVRGATAAVTCMQYSHAPFLSPTSLLSVWNLAQVIKFRLRDGRVQQILLIISKFECLIIGCPLHSSSQIVEGLPCRRKPPRLVVWNSTKITVAALSLLCRATLLSQTCFPAVAAAAMASIVVFDTC